MHPYVILLMFYAVIALPLAFIRPDFTRFLIGIAAGVLISQHQWPDIPLQTASDIEWGAFAGVVAALVLTGLIVMIFGMIWRMFYIWIRTGDVSEPNTPIYAIQRLTIVACLIFYTGAGFYIQYGAEATEIKRLSRSLQEGRSRFQRKNAYGSPSSTIDPSNNAFKANYIKSFVSACKNKQRGDVAQLHISTTKLIEAYCHCAAEKTISEFTIAEIRNLMQNGFRPASSYTQKMLLAALPCVDEVYKAK